MQNAMEKNAETGAHAESLVVSEACFFSSSWKQIVLKIGFKYFALKNPQNFV